MRGGMPDCKWLTRNWGAEQETHSTVERADLIILHYLSTYQEGGQPDTLKSKLDNNSICSTLAMVGRFSATVSSIRQGKVDQWVYLAATVLTAVLSPPWQPHCNFPTPFLRSPWQPHYNSTQPYISHHDNFTATLPSISHHDNSTAPLLYTISVTMTASNSTQLSITALWQPHRNSTITISLTMSTSMEALA